MTSSPEVPMQQQDGAEIDPIWTSSRTARQIMALMEVEKDIGRLLALAGSSISLLTLPQTDDPADTLPQDEMRSEHFVEEVTKYFEVLDSVQFQIRSSLTHIRQARTAPSAIVAPPPGALPPALGVGLPSGSGATSTAGLQEERVARDAWVGVRDALERLKAARGAAVGTPESGRVEEGGVGDGSPMKEG